MYYRWNEEKNKKLINERGVGFQDIIDALQAGGLIDLIPHPNVALYPHQWMYVIVYNHYVYTVPFVYESKEEIFLKTIVPQRKYKKLYFSHTDG